MSSKRGKSKVANEAYFTPLDAVNALMKVIEFRPTDTFLEPARGEKRAIYDAVPLPDMQKSWAELSEGVNYLTTPFEKQDVIITNPPFSLTCEFMIKSFSELKPDGTLIYLQRLNFLGSIKRIPFWEQVGTPEKTAVLVPRPRFDGHSDSTEYAWFIYDQGNRVKLKTGISHLFSEIK